MLTDIFARRYGTLPLWKAFEEPSRRLLVQTFQLVTQIQPYYINGKESFEGKVFWGALHNLLARELGLQELSPKTWGYWTPQKTWASGTYSMHSVCERWMLLNFDGSIAADQHIKERLSLVEIGFRMHEGTIGFKSHQTMAEAVKNDERALRKGFVTSMSCLDRAKASIDLMNQSFNDAVNELNERFKHAGTHLIPKASVTDSLGIPGSGRM
ncbi:hypothetical protein [Rhodoplanes elegans]|uniref:hypothetical protein n=1 Tax=Rhodoplanes elegans TaxID=29408 RepID=UPI0011B94978|nr:hypothetical protein [Rhodoplanes elegans]